MAKQTFGKDDNGTFHPGKGKPSGVNKSEGLGLQATPPEKLEEYLELTEKYTSGEDELDPSVRLMHPNRNTSKGEDVYKAKENKPKSDKSNIDITNEEEEEESVVPEQLPGVLTKEAFTELANFTGDCCVSIFIAVHEAGVEVNENYDPVNFKNKLQETSNRLLEKGRDEPFIQRLLKPGFELVRDDEFWKELSPGLVVFIAEGFFKFIKMPLQPVEELIVIKPTFHVTPLIPIMTCKEYFYLLLIGKKYAKLFKADCWGMENVDIELPQSIDEVKRLSGSDATTFRSGSSGSRAPKASQEGSYHGAGGGNPDDKDNMLVYFEAVDDIIWQNVLHDENVPLLLSAVEYEVPIYRNACDYAYVWPEALTGNRQLQKTSVLFQEAKEFMRPYFEQGLNKAMDLYMNNTANSKTSSIAADVIPATYYAQVSHLFVTKGEHIWGTFDEMTNELVFHDTPDEGGEDLIDNAVVKTLANGGQVFLLEKERMPVETQMAAILRF